MRDSLGETVTSWALVGAAVLVLFALVSKYLFLFGLGVAVGLVLAYEMIRRWAGCLL